MKKKYVREICDEVDKVIRGNYLVDIDKAVSAFEKVFGELHFVDEKIDDGCRDDEPDNYVMMRSYNFTYKGVNFYLRLYYGNCTGLLGYYDLDIE